MSEHGTPPAIVAALDDRDDLERALDGLQQAFVDRSQLSILARQETMTEKLSGLFQADLSMPSDREADSRGEVNERSAEGLKRTPLTEKAEVGNAMGILTSIPAYIAAVLAAGAVALTGGTILGITAAAVAAGGGAGLLGGVAAKGMSDRVDASFDEELKRGGILLQVSPRNDDEATKAREVLRGLNARILDHAPKAD